VISQGRIHSMIPSLLSWYDTCARALPWRENRDPYRVWVSEIMLQQTRVEAVKPYFQRFMDRLPTIKDLAEISEDELMKLWEGLGYYSRARNLRKAAIKIVNEYDGVFPRSYDKILSLPGIGAYTAGAVASICFERPTPAVDGNVLRIIARITGDDSDILSQSFKTHVTALLSQCYPTGRCGDFTQSLMELGATVCIPNGMPICKSCPVRNYCAAYEENLQAALPVKTPKKPRRAEDRTVFLLYCGDHIAVRKRREKGLLCGLWEFPNTEGFLDEDSVSAYFRQIGVAVTSVRRNPDEKHIFTHVEWHMQCYSVQCSEQLKEYVWVSKAELLDTVPLPTAFRRFLKFVKLP